MQILENSIVKEKIYTEKLENGLTVMILPKKDTLKKYVIWGTNYGSNDSKFIVPGEEQETAVPDGIAHFLEHKLFEQKNGTNSLDTLSALGVNANAYTTNDHTAYLFECTDNFYPALDEFMDYVQNPYFTDENVEKEKGIIGQEIMMYDDHPFWRVYMNTMDCLYHNNPIKIDIAGTIESIAEIDKEVLYKCYNTFYNPSNMLLFVAGDFVPEEILEEIKKRLINSHSQTEIKRIYPEEPKEINKNTSVKEMELSEPLFIIGIKDPIGENCAPAQSEMVRKHIGIEILLNMLVGKSSETYKKMYDKGLIIAEPDTDYEFTKYYGHITIGGQSKDPEKILEIIKEKIKEYQKNGLDKEHFERIKKMIYGDYIKEYNDIAGISRMFMSDYFKGINSFDYLEEFKTISLEYVHDLLKGLLKEENMILSIVK